ncbi:monosaccharide ABC transporter ATP-binding protein (CUT2 family) [Lachnotalea glycerini]|uniref:Monosaccharide ABC transporter ATP-binding protein (CUT2 family) n=1 Tax=Lachnotalea glycerini TaxID=1763509 RepID=A0A318EGF2_9FIRM|nr:sugar ABC transporter ATP-binding protein [Lachnotalea glycerini]PXV84902.1 monosaccharide ABC transporter ATP-binding protein (CUT2 family) [Lachnotalea glycerini]
MSQEYILEAKMINKSFSGVQVLKNVNLGIKKGEVHALMGENGAGKSTLIKIITGVYTKDSGKILWKGKEVDINNSKDLQSLGIACVYQELSVIPVLTVAQNIYLGKEPKIKNTGLIDYKKMNQMAQSLIDQYEFPLKSTDIVDTLGIGLRQLVEILKGLAIDSELLIMDEPTASLSGRESAILFKIIDSLRKKGVSIIYISHRLEEVYMLSDRLTILRDGMNAAILEKEEIKPVAVIQTMIGKVVDESAGSVKTLTKNKNEITLKVDNLTRKGVFEDISFEVHRGEIVGFGGLIGAGRTEVMRCLFGVDKYNNGKIYLEGKEFVPTSTRKSIKSGFGFIPEDRRGQGFIPLTSINKNIALTNYDIIKKIGLAVSSKDELEMCLKAIKKIDIRPNNPDKSVGLLSGGNQQKVVIGKWLMRDLKVLMVDEPTAGIDVGAKNEIYNILSELADKGVVILLVSSDLQELLRVSHRIVIMRKGHIIKEFSEGTVTQADILQAASGIESDEEVAL